MSLGIWVNGSAGTVSLGPRLVCASACLSGGSAFIAGLVCRAHVNVKTPRVLVANSSPFRHCTMDLTWIIPFHPHNNPMVLALSLPHFIGEKTEAQNSK